MALNELALLQLCDSNFPTGAFSHSFGLESYIQDGVVHDAPSFIKWLEVYLNEQLVYTDGLAARMAYESLKNNQSEAIWKLDRLLTVQNFARETRDGTKRMGERMAKITAELYQGPMLPLYYERIKSKQAYGHPAIVFTMVGHLFQIQEETTILYYLYSTITSLVQNAVRAIPLGQTAGQKIIFLFQPKLHEAVNRIIDLNEEEFGIVSTGLELSQMRHERVNIRIFMS